MTQVKHSFGGGINGDGSAESIGSQEYIGSENFRFSSKLFGDFNRMEMVESNRRITNAAALPGVNVVVGSCVDTARDRIIYCVWSTLGNHAIYVMQQDETVLLAIKNDNTVEGLKFQKDNPVHSCDIIGDLFYWVCDGEPYRINIEAALKANNSGYSYAGSAYTWPINYNIQTVIRKPPNFLPEVAKVADATIKVNQIKDFSFRFAYRYEYRDGETSTLSAHSLLAPANYATQTAAGINAIDVTIPFGEKIEQDVVAIELIAAYAYEENFFVIKRWDRGNTADLAEIAAHNSVLTKLSFRFSNSTIGSAISNADKIKLFDNVPVYSRAMAIAKNRLFLGNNTMGYDTPKKSSLSFSLATVSNTTNATGSWVKATIDYRIDGATVQTRVVYLYFLPITYGSFLAGYYYSVAYGSNSTGPTTSDLSTYAYLGYNLTTYQNPADNLPQNYYDLRVFTFDFDAAISYIEVMNANVPASNITVNIQNDLNRLMKSAAGYMGGVVFYDRFMRQCGVAESKTAAITTASRAYADATTFNYGISFALTNADRLTEIPEWAYYYSVVVSKCMRTNFFIQSRTTDTKYATLNPLTKEYVFETTAAGQGLAGIAVKASLLYGYGLGYKYSEGDMMRLHRGTDIFEVPVKGTQGEWIIGEYFNAASLASGASLFEIYTPMQASTEKLYYEAGNMYRIDAPGTAARAYSTLTGLLPGDVYLITRNDGTADYLVEAMNPNDKIWKQWHTAHGRVQAVDRIGQVKKETSVSFSNVFIPGTRVNGMSAFDALNEEILPAQLSALRKLTLTNKVQQEGTLMLAIGEDEAMSIYLGETQVQDVNGAAYVAQSSSVIGTVNTLRGSSGTRHPESVAKYMGLVFWLDVVKGRVVQYSTAGLTVISNNKLSIFWRQWCAAYRKTAATYWVATNQRPVINAGIDEYTNEYLITLPAIARGQITINSTWNMFDGRAKTMSFSYRENKWVGAFSYYADGICMLNNVLYTFKAADPYAHDVDSGVCSFYGVSYSAFVMIAESAQAFDVTKIWNTISVIGNAAPDFLLAESFLPYYQQTDLLAEEFRNIEGKYFASFRRNKISDVLAPGDALVSGDKMRGQTLYVLLSFNGQQGTPNRIKRVFLNSVYFGIFLSKGQTI